MCATLPQPPEATTGTRTASATARVSAMSKPSFVPSRSMLVSRISPAPRSAPSRAQATASLPVAVRPPWTKTSKPELFARASIASTTACEPKRRASSSSRAGSLHGRGVDGDLVGAGPQQHLGVVQRSARRRLP